MPPLQRETKQLVFSKYTDQTLVACSPIVLMMEKLGRMILKEEDSNSIGNLMTKELASI
jgi:hypothetical protein